MQENNITQKPNGIDTAAGVPVQFGDYKVELTDNGVLVIHTENDVCAIHKSQDGKIRLIEKHG